MPRGRSIRRREFLARAAALGAAGAVSLAADPLRAATFRRRRPDAIAGLLPGGQGIMLDKVTVSTFAEHVGGMFRIRPDDAAPLTVTLIEAESLGPETAASGQASRRRAFSLVFRGPIEPVLPQRIYRMEHETLGPFELFLVPIGPDETGMRYEAVFN